MLGGEGVGFDGVGEEGGVDFFGSVFLDFVSDVAFEFKPGALEQTGPHVGSLDGLGEEGLLLAAEDVVVDEDVMVFRACVYLQRADTVGVGFG